MLNMNRQIPIYTEPGVKYNTICSIVYTQTLPKTMFAALLRAPVQISTANIVSTVLVMVLLSGPIMAQTSYEVQRHVVQCLNEISSRYFPSAHALVLAYHNYELEEHQSGIRGKNIRYRENACYLETDVREKLLQDLQESEKWSLFVYSNDARIKKQMPHGKHGAYIIVLYHYQRVVQDTSVLIKKLTNDWDWNPRARFVIAVIPAEENPAEQLAADIFTELWKWRVVNAVVLISTPGPQDTRDTIPLLDMYTWFPYHPPGRCADVRDAVLLDRWVVDRKGCGSFLYNMSLFPDKVPKDLEGCPIIASVFELPPAVISRKDTKQDSTHTVFDEGIEIRLLQEFGTNANMSLKYTEPLSTELWGVPQENGSWTGTSGQLIRGTVDMAMDLYFYRCDIIKETECLTPHLIDKVRWYVPCAAPYPGWMSIVRVFTLSLWFGFLVSYVVFAVAMCQMVKISNRMFFQPTKNHAYTSLVKCLMNFWAVIPGQSTPNNPPQQPVFRVVFLIWIWYCFVINTVYQTYLTTFLVDPGLQHQISSNEEVINSGMEYGVPTTILTVITELTGYRYRHLLYCDDHKACQNRVAFKRDFSYIYSTLSMEFIIASRYTDGNGKHLICSFEEVISSQLITIPVPKGYVMLDRFNKVILHLLQGGILDHWFRDLKYTTFLSSAAETSLLTGEYVKLSLLHMQSAVYILLLGLVLSCIAFFSEILCCRNSRLLHS
jgi:hypothetical protein